MNRTISENNRADKTRNQGKDLSDLTLYNLFLSGDTGAYDALMLRHGDSLVFYLNGYLHDWHYAEDLMIEAFARIMIKKPKLKEDAFKAYLYKTARNLASRFHEKLSRHREFSLDELSGWNPEERSSGGRLQGDSSAAFRGSGPDTETFAGGILPEEKLLDRERREMLHFCLSRIDPELREAIWLVYFEDMSYDQAGTVMRVSKKRIDHLLTRGKKNLKKELEKEGITDAFG